jgi:hypothetical protein
MVHANTTTGNLRTIDPANIVHADRHDVSQGPKARGFEWTCAICGQGLETHGAKRTFWIHQLTNGLWAAHGQTVPENLDQGMFPIGPNCYKRHAEALAGFVKRITQTERGIYEVVV